MAGVGYCNDSGAGSNNSTWQAMLGVGYRFVGCAHQQAAGGGNG